MGDKMKEDETFSTLKEVDNCLRHYFNETKQLFRIKDCRRNENNELEYSNLLLVCICAGEFVPVGTKRKREKTIKTNCPAEMKLQLCGNKLKIRRINLTHNHEPVPNCVYKSLTDRKRNVTSLKKAHKVETSEEDKEKTVLEADASSIEDGCPEKNKQNDSAKQVSPKKHNVTKIDMFTQTDDIAFKKRDAFTQTYGSLYQGPKIFHKKNDEEKKITLFKWLNLEDKIIAETMIDDKKISINIINHITQEKINDAFRNATVDYTILKEHMKPEAYKILSDVLNKIQGNDTEYCGRCKSDTVKGRKVVQWVECACCLHWYHFHCENINRTPAKDDDFVCKTCALL